MKKKENYINKEEMLVELLKSRKTEVVTEKLHLMLYEMAKRIATKKNWSGYNYTPDFVTTSYLKCLNAIPKIDINRENLNAYGYFTTIIHYSNIDMIKFEQRQNEYKQKAMDSYVEQLKCEFNIVDNRTKYNRDWEI